MPRRKAHGISPAKRAPHTSKDDLQARKKAADNNEDPGGGRVPYSPQMVLSAQNTTKLKPSEIAAGPDLNSKYLHKKFKKMATASPVSVANSFKSMDEAAVNGIGVVSRPDLGMESLTEELGMRISYSEREGFRGNTSQGGAGTERLSSPGMPSVSTSQQGRYVCPYCKLACAKPSVLQKHIRAHTNERPYPCRPCGFAFKTKSNLYKHCRSRAHALKMEEEGSSGVKFNFPSADSSEDIEDDEDENNSNNTPPPPSLPLSSNLETSSSYNSTTNVPMSSNSSSNTSPCTTMSLSGSEANNNQDKPRQIYKPKFHKAALYQEEEEKEQAVAASMKTKPAAQQPQLSLKIPSNPSSQALPLSPSVFASIKNPSSPSPEFIQRHISKIISENQAIVETSDAQWPKKFQRQSTRELLREGSPASPLSAASSPGLDGTCAWPKKVFNRQMSLGSTLQIDNTETEKTRLLTNTITQHSVHSKLALALLRPSRLESSSSPRTCESPMSAVSTTPEPTSAYQQPLNLSTSHDASKPSCDNNADPSGVIHRKRSYSESFGAIGAPGRNQGQNMMTVLKDHNILAASNSTSLNRLRGQSHTNKFTRLEGAGNAIVVLDASTAKNHTNDKLFFHPQNPEGSIIKDLLLKTRAGLSVTKPGGVYSAMADILVNPELVSTLPAPYLPTTTIAQEESFNSSSATTQYICSLCNIPYRNAENLEIHQLYYCKGEATAQVALGGALSPRHSPGIPLSFVSMPSQTLELQGQSEDAGSLSEPPVKGTNVKMKHANKLDLKISLVKENNIKATNLVVPPFPSPGPLLGSTPLVDSYHQTHHQQKKKKEEELEGDDLEDVRRRGSLPKKRRLDMDISSRDTGSSTSPDIRPLSTTPILGITIPSTTTLRSLEELSKCPMRPNSLQMFGGEVQILDGAGEMKTMRIEPSSRGGKSPGASSATADLILSLPNHLHHGSVLVGSTSNKACTNETNTDSVCASVSPHIVVTIARSSLHSGGTIVQVPQKSPGASSVSSSSCVKPPRSSGGSISCSTQLQKPVQKTSGSSGGMILNSPSHSPLTYSTSALLASNTNTATNVFSDTTKLLVPLIPNITTPNLAVPGIPAPNLGHYLPFMSCTSILPDGTLLNPLTHITAYNPLTLPPHSSAHNLHNMKLSQPKEKKCVEIGDNNILPPYSGGVVTILHGGKAIPYVPGMPGPHTLLSTIPSLVTNKKRASPKPLDLASPAKDSLLSQKASDAVKLPSVNPQSSTPIISKIIRNQALSTIAVTSESAATSSHPDEFSRTTTSNSSSLTDPLKLAINAYTAIPSIKVDCAVSNVDVGGESMSSGDESSLRSTTRSPSVRRNPKTSKFLLALKDAEEKPHEEGVIKAGKLSEGNNINKCETESGSDGTKVKGGTNKPKFLRPSSLPLKPGTFTPKKFHGTGLTPTGMVLSLVSPETPRPKKSYGQLYLNGHAYTYLGLKCSTRAYYCTLNRPQPMYVPQSPEHAKLSMYSNWKVCSEADPNPFGLDPGRAMALYDSRHRPTSYTVSRLSERQPMVLTHSSYWLNRSEQQQLRDKPKAETGPSDKPQTDGGIKTEGADNSTPGEPPPRRVKIFDGGFESNEDYIYVRGRGRGRYVCEECGIRCKKPSMLKKHIRTHTDVRPFTCKHCNFSFKTKGNLTKHMKSKAHYKKCIELGIVPVPTVVDDSYIDEECLARQQALRASRHGEGETDSDDNEEEEDEDDDDEEEDEEESQQLGDDGDGIGNNKGKLEREAACSLLSLSESTRTSTLSTHHHYISAGLIPLSANSGRPNTYPYTLTLPLPGPGGPGNSTNTPQTPTLSTVSAQTEREKVSHNTGLALELRSGADSEFKEEEGRVSSTIRRRGNAAALVLIPPHGDANRYYFPSCRTPTIATNVSMSALSKSLSDDKSWTDGGSDSEEYYENDNSSADNTDEEDSELSDAEKLSRKLPGNTYDKAEVMEGNFSVSQQPMDLSNKSLPATRRLSTTSIPYYPPAILLNSARTPTTPISDILTPVSEPATLIASLCSSMERFPVTNSMLAQKCLSPDPAETTMLQAYLTERALQDVRMKQHQYHNHHNYNTPSSSSTMTETSSKPVLLRIPTPLKDLVPKEMPPRSVALMMSQSTAEPVTLHMQSPAMQSKESDLTVEPSAESLDSKKGIKVPLSCGESIEQNSLTSERIKIKEGTPVKMQVPTEGMPTKVPLVSISNSNIVRNVVVGGSAFNTPPSASPPPPTSGNSLVANPSTSKPKAEFLPPSSGPSSSYVSITEDGRSICVICNKIFSKPSQLRLHVNIHYFERPFRCESCAVSFRTKGHLQKHERSVSHQNKVSMNSTFGTPTTTNPRPFKCDDCKVAFRIHGHLAKHLRSKMHIMKLECVGKLPFGTYAEMEREGISLNEIDTTDCENSLESLQILAQKLYEKDPSKLGQWDGEREEMLPPIPHPHLSGGETSSDEGEPLLGCHSPHHQDSLTFHVAELNLRLKSQTATRPLHDQEGSTIHVTDMKEESPNHTPAKSTLSLGYNPDLLERNIMECVSENVASHTTPKLHLPANSNNQNSAEECVRGAGKILSHFNIGYSSDQNNISTRERQQHISVSNPQQSKPSNSVDKRDFQTDAEGKVIRVLPPDKHAQCRPNLHQQSASMEVDKTNASYGNSIGCADNEMHKRKGHCSEEADYEDASDGDNESGTKNQFACNVCHQMLPNLGSLQVHSFVEHDSSADMTEEDSHHCASSVGTVSHSHKTNPNLNKTLESKVSDVSFLNQLRKRSAAGIREIQDPVVLRQSFKRSKVDSDSKISSLFRQADNQSPVSNCTDVERITSVVQQRVPESNRQSVATEDKVERKECKTQISDECKLARDMETEKDSRRHEFWTAESTKHLQVSSDRMKQSVDKTLVHSPKQLSLDYRESVNANSLCLTSEHQVQSLEEVGGQNRDESAKNTTLGSEVDQEPGLESRSSASSGCIATGSQRKLNCDLCGKVQHSQESLQKHLLSHAQPRPFVCELCDAGFISRQQLRSHLDVHQQPTATFKSQ